MVFALAGEQDFMLRIGRHNIDLRVFFPIFITPVGADFGRRKVHRAATAQGSKNILADGFIGKCDEFPDEILFQFIQDDLGIVQFQLSLEGIDVPEPEPHEIV